MLYNPCYFHWITAFLYRLQLQKLPLLCRLEAEFSGALSLLLPHLRPALYRGGDVIGTPQVRTLDQFFSPLAT
jgi:hypothetical protein